MTETDPRSGPGVGALFDAVADDYDQSGVDFFAPIAQGLVDELAPASGERAVDLGCGRGAATILLARSVGETGSAVGLDLSEGMLAHARAAIDSEGLVVDLRVGDASEPALPEGEFDVVASSLVLFFLPNPGAALARWVQLLAPGGRIGLATFGQQDPVWTSVDREFGPWLPPAMRDPRVMGPQSPFGSDEGMEQLLEDAGAAEVETTTLRLPVRFGTLDRWEAFSRGTGQRAMWASVPADEIAGVRERAATHFEGARTADGDVEVWQDIRYTLGRAPGPDAA
ncbi:MULTISPECIES: class I SAM-dependent methyltransferase [unclassified Knoellia]|uniref:class I SAM-dependent methyltransferase n=1 Tax=Knoellia altitudinis TaxID=3404795 RepID=UPI00361904F7